MRHILILLIAIPLLSLSTLGQSFTKDMKAINYAYLDLNKTMVLNTSVSGEGNTTTKMRISVAMKSIDDYYMEGENTEILVQNNLKIAINHNLKVVMISANKLDSKEDLPIKLFDALPEFYTSIKHSKGAGFEKYTLVPKAGNSKSIEMTFSRNSMLLSQVKVTRYDPRTQKSHVITNSYTYSSLEVTSIPKVAKFYNESTKKLQGTYSTYELINNL